MTYINPTPPLLTDQEIIRFWNTVVRTDGCWEWQGYRTSRGYGTFSFYRLRRTVSVHRLAYFLAYDIWPTLCVLHQCDNPPCVRPDHLFLGTQADNLVDMAAKGRSLQGDRNGMARYTEEMIRQVFALKQSDYSVKQIAEMFSMGETYVRKILRGEIWRHIWLECLNPPGRIKSYPSLLPRGG